jgi:hypothetical protein
LAISGKALIELAEEAFARVDDAGELTESSQYLGFMDSEALILASIYPDRQLRVTDS